MFNAAPPMFVALSAQVFPADKPSRSLARPTRMIVGVALKGVHTLAVSAKGFEGVGPVFRVDATIDDNGQHQNQPGRVREGCRPLYMRAAHRCRACDLPDAFYVVLLRLVVPN